ncbi:MAG: AMP-binding protein [Proteobacteria bacterium]|nr:AMP-binding protein [Pseudomonadota bacterium]
MNAVFDKRESQSEESRNLYLLEALRRQLVNAKSSSAYWSKILKEVEPDDFTSLEDIAQLPVLRKSELIEIQPQDYLGGLATADRTASKRIFFSPGPLIEPQPMAAADPWRMAPALFSAGFGPEDIVANCFSYHITPAGFMFDAAAQKIGCTVFPAGVQNVDMLVEAFHRLEITAYAGTPDFLKIILEKADDLGRPITGIQKAMVSGGPLFPDVKAYYEARGIELRQSYGTAELGLIAFETGNASEGMVIAEDCIVEIVRPGSNIPVSDGEVGEVVVTTFDPHYPLIRFGTGDLSAIMSSASSCGRTNRRLKGWLGRADQTAKVKGMFVHPQQVENVIKRLPGILKARLQVESLDGRDAMTFLCEHEERSENLIPEISEIVKAECRVRGNVVLVAPNSLPNDGKVIDDQRIAGIGI